MSTQYSLIRSITVVPHEGSHLPGVARQAATLARIAQKDVAILFNREIVTIERWMLGMDDSFIIDRVQRQFNDAIKRRYL